MSPSRAVVVGTSAGGPDALSRLLAALPQSFAPPVVVVQHVHRDSPGTWPDLLGQRLGRTVKNAEDKEPLEPGVIYMAPPGYHLLIERDRSCSLCVDELVSYARPSVDVLFRSAADAFGDQLLAVVLTGANADGAAGAADVLRRGGQVLAEDPHTAHVPTMPRAALAAAPGARALSLEEIAAAMVLFAQGESP